MNSDRIVQALENGLVERINKGDVFKFDYGSMIDAAPELKKAYANIDHSKVFRRITEILEEELARKIVDKIVTEMGTDIKKLMENATIREDFRFLLRKGVTDILNKIKEGA